jgi:UDP-N-acetylmuramoyl-L-alanyl-D-glutamate--2,6-diaminopimelate ligase
MIKSLGTLLENLEVLEVHGDLGTPVRGIAYDSRRVVEGDLFVAVSGTRQDGNRFIEDAISRGACAVFVEKVPEAGLPVACVRVADSRKALARLAAAFYDNPSRSFELIGITGTNGKTTTTLLLESILKKADHSPAVLGTLGYRWDGRQKTAAMTTPESLDLHGLFHEMRQDAVSHVVMEVSSHALALGRVEGCAFKAGIFTNLSQDHLDFHSTMESYFEAKALLFKNHLSMNGKVSVGIINADDPYGNRLTEVSAGDLWSYSVAHRAARVWVKNAEMTPSGIRAIISAPSGEFEVRSPLLGRLNLYNLLAAATTALALGISKEAIREGLEAVSYVDGRLQRVSIPGECGFEVVVDYAHTPDAMEKSLACLREMTRGRILVVFGCGGDRDRGKRPLMGRVAAELGDLVIVTSDNPRSEVPEAIIRDIEPGVKSAGLELVGPGSPPDNGKGYTIEVDRKHAIELALGWARPGDIVFIGGKGHETYQIIGGQVFPFDDRVVVRDFFYASKG